MDASTRTLTPSRIVALVVIGVLVAGLGLLWLLPEQRGVAVPPGADDGDLFLDACEYSTEDGSYAADCGTLVVREQRTDPDSRLIALPVTRIRARSDRPAEPVFRLEGGPGLTNMDFPHASRFTGQRDVVLVGYRGVDGSVRLDCPEVESALARSTDFLASPSLRAYGDAFRACAGRLTADGVDLAAYGPVQRVDDLEAARVALGYDAVDLLSESAGTRAAMIYAWRYPRSIHRSVMIGVNPPGHFLWDERITDDQIRRYADLCSTDAGCSERTDDLVASMRATAADMPRRWLVLPIKEGHVRVFTFVGLMESSAALAPLSAPTTLDAWLAADEGDASGLWFQSLAAGLVLPKSFVWGEYAGFGSVDADVVRNSLPRSPRGRVSVLDDAGSVLVWGDGRLADAWPTAAGSRDYSRVLTSEVETLLVSGALDVATPPQVATEEFLPHLTRGHAVVIPGIGHSVSFYTEQQAAGTRLINTFLDSGRVDDSLYRPQHVDLTPGLTQTDLAKVIAGTLLGLALLAVVSLLWMAHRVHRRLPFGRTAGVALRSGYLVVLGLGGWSLGALAVLTTMPGTPLDDDLLVGLSVGLAVGLGVYLPWASECSVSTRPTGLAAALGGALVGAWAGYHVTDDLLALVTAVVGAAAGGNLTLLALDLTRPPRVPATSTATGPAATASLPSVGTGTDVAPAISESVPSGTHLIRNGE